MPKSLDVRRHLPSAAFVILVLPLLLRRLRPRVAHFQHASTPVRAN